ncbi:MAG: hypothetical protein DCC75_07830 [Proteobacteria bacterium]|nr:MAG: hypothetical protein DCC75_07830 [Pseudomonadota bacterium]
MLSRICVVLLLSLFAASTAAEPPKESRVVIAGAGLSGLATAYELKKAGIPYHILELSPRAGGRVRTAHYQVDGEDITTDSGMEEYWESNPAVQVIKELGLNYTKDIAISSIIIDGKLHPLKKAGRQEFLTGLFGDKGLADLRRFEDALLPILKKLKLGQEIPKEHLNLKDTDFASWVGGFSLPRNVSEWIRISLECEIGTEWSRISALDGIAEYHIFLGEGEECYRIEGGNQVFTEAFAGAVGLENISYEKRVTRVVTERNKVYVHYQDQSTNNYGIIEAAHFVSTIPLYRLLFEVQFEPPLSEKKKLAVITQNWGSYFKAHIFLDPKASRFWTKDGESILPLLSDSALGVIYDGTPSDVKKTAVLSLLITGSHAETFNLTPLDQVRATIIPELEKLFPGITKMLKGVEFHRVHPRAIAAWPTGRSRFDEQSNEIRRPENRVYLAGDFTETSHSDGAFISAKRVVGDIASSR